MGGGEREGGEGGERMGLFIKIPSAWLSEVYFQVCGSLKGNSRVFVLRSEEGIWCMFMYLVRLLFCPD